MFHFYISSHLIFIRLLILFLMKKAHQDFIQKSRIFLSNYFAMRLSPLDFLQDQGLVRIVSFHFDGQGVNFSMSTGLFSTFFSVVAGRPKQSEFLMSSQAYTNARQIAFGQMFGVFATQSVFTKFAASICLEKTKTRIFKITIYNTRN